MGDLRSIITGALPPASDAPPANAGQVAHYTRMSALPHMLRHSDSSLQAGWSSAWATPIQFLNDREEFFLGLRVLAEEASKMPVDQTVQAALELLKTTGGALSYDAFQVSFSGVHDELGQWRAYGANGFGCCIVTDIDSIVQLAGERNCVSGWVIYRADQHQAFAHSVLERLAGLPDAGLPDASLRGTVRAVAVKLAAVTQTLVAAAGFMKNEGFKAEREYRFIEFPPRDRVEFREVGDRIVPFTDILVGRSVLHVHRLVIGPSWKLMRLTDAEQVLDHIMQSVNRLTERCGLAPVDIDFSRIPYDPR